MEKAGEHKRERMGSFNAHRPAAKYNIHESTIFLLLLHKKKKRQKRDEIENDEGNEVYLGARLMVSTAPRYRAIHNVPKCSSSVFECLAPSFGRPYLRRI